MSALSVRSAPSVLIEQLEGRMLLSGDPLPAAVQETPYHASSLTADPQRNLVYYSIREPTRIVAFDTDRARIASVATVLGDAADSICTSVDGSRLFVSQTWSKKILVFSLPGLTQVATLNTDTPYYVMAHGAQNRLYVRRTDYSGDFQLDAGTGKRLRSIQGGSFSMGAGGNRFAVSSDETLSIYDSSGTGAPTLISTHTGLPQNRRFITFDTARNRVYQLGYELNGVYVVNTNTDARTTWAFTDQYNPGAAIAFHPDVNDLFAVSSSGPYWSQFRIADGTPVANAPGAAADLIFDFSAAMTKNGRTLVAGGDSTTRHYSLGIIGSATISANSLPPTAKINATAYSSMRRVFDAFNSQPGNNGLTINKALWRFGDGTHAYGLQVSHTYALPGEYKARLTVTNSGGATNDAFVTVRAGDTTNTGSISGTVFGDLNSNGVRDSSKEKIVPNGYVWWDLNNDGKQNNGEPWSYVQADGKFALLNLAAGGPRKLRAFFYPYVMTIAPKIKLAPGAEISGVNLAVEKAGVISSYVFNDINRNGRKDAFEDGAARRVWIDSDADGILDSNEQSTMSNADGLFSFIALTSGTYHLRVELAKGDTQITPSPGRAIDLSVKTWQKSRSDFAIRLPTNSTITGTVYNDLNGNGVRDSGELALIKQTVFLDYNNNGKLDAGEDAVRTNGIGKYTLPAYARPTGSVFGNTSSYYSVLAAMPAPWRHSSFQVFLVPPNTSVLADVPVTQTA